MEKRFVELRQKQGRDTHLERKCVGSPLVRRSTVKRRLSHSYRPVLPGPSLPSASYVVSFSTWSTLGPSPWCAHTLSQDGFRSEGFWEEEGSLWPGIVPRLLTHKKPSCACLVSPLSQKRGSSNPWILFSHRVLPLFVLALTITLTIAMTVTLRCLQETNPGYLPRFCCYFHFRGQTGGWLYMP